MIKKIWGDPVWSKVISVGIIALITLGYTKFLSLSEEVSFKEAFDKILGIKISVIYVVIVLIVYWIFSWVFRKIFKKEKAFYNSKQEKLRTFNKMIDPDTGVLYKWDVFFDYDKPFISDLTAFCTKHGEPPIRFMGEICPMRGCENSRQHTNKYAVENFIESALIDRWEKLQ